MYDNSSLFSNTLYGGIMFDVKLYGVFGEKLLSCI